MCLFLTSGVSVLRCEMNAGTDMMWRRKDLSRLSEKCAAITGLKHTRIKSSSNYRSLPRNRATDIIRLWDVSESKASSHGNRPEWQRKNGREGSFGKGRSGSCQSICKQNLQTAKMLHQKCILCFHKNSRKQLIPTLIMVRNVYYYFTNSL